MSSCSNWGVDFGAKQLAIVPTTPREVSYLLISMTASLSLKQNLPKQGSALAMFSDWTIWSVSCDKWVCFANGISAATSLIASPINRFIVIIAMNIRKITNKADWAKNRVKSEGDAKTSSGSTLPIIMETTLKPEIHEAYYVIQSINLN